MYVRTAALGSRLARWPKAEATELAPAKQSAQALLWRLDTAGPTGPARRDGFPVGTRSATGETLEPRLWAIQGEDRRACPALKIGSHLSFQSLSTAADWDDRRSPASSHSCPPHCDLVEPVCAPPAQGLLSANRIRRSAGSDPGSAPSTHRPAGLRPAAAGGACPLACPDARSGNAGSRRKTCSRWRSRALRRDTESQPDLGTVSAFDADWESAPPAARNACSTPASTLSPERHWPIPEWKPWPTAGALTNRSWAVRKLRSA